MDQKKILSSELLNKAALSRAIGIATPSYFTQKINNVGSCKLTGKDTQKIKKVFEKAIKKAEIINIKELFEIFLLIINPDNKEREKAIKIIINNYQDKYADIGLIEWYEGKILNK